MPARNDFKLIKNHNDYIKNRNILVNDSKVTEIFIKCYKKNKNH